MINPTLRILLAALILCSPPVTANAEKLPKAFHATYKARYSGFDITAERSLQTLDNGAQMLRFKADSWMATIEEQSQFHWGRHGYLVREQYRYERKVLGKIRQAQLTFDWQQQQVTNDVQNSVWQMPLPKVALDKLGYQLQLRKDLINQRQPGSYEIADGGRLKTYEFAVLGEEIVDTPLGKLKAVQIKRIRENNKRTTHIWLATDWDYLIVKLQQTEKDGKAYEINLSSAIVGEQTVTGL